jgi:hypothetical protein
MYLLSRNARLNSAAAVEWAQQVLGRAREVTGCGIDLWATAFSPSLGRVAWTSWWPDLSTLEASSIALRGDAKYLAMVAEGRAHIEGEIDDELLLLVHGELDPQRVESVKYVSTVQAVCAAGSAERALAAGAQTAQRAQDLTGLPTLFLSAMTGPYGGVGWITGYDSLGELETAQGKLAVEPSWMANIDAMAGCFVEDPAITQQTLYERVS